MILLQQEMTDLRLLSIIIHFFIALQFIHFMLRVKLIIHLSYLSVSNYIAQKYVAPVLSKNSFDYLILNKNDWTKEIIDDIEHLFKDSDSDTLELEILETCFRSLRCIYKNIDFSKISKTTSPMYDETFKDMMLFIQDHYMEKVSLEDIANAGNVGKTLCAKIF